MTPLQKIRSRMDNHWYHMKDVFPIVVESYIVEDYFDPETTIDLVTILIEEDFFELKKDNVDYVKIMDKWYGYI